MAYRPHFMLAVLSLFAMTACQGGSGLSGSNPIPSSVSPATNSSSSSLSPLSLLKAAPQGIRTYVHLPLRNVADLTRLIQEQSSKDSPMFHRFLTVAQFRDAYGPESRALESVARTLKADGFKTTITSQGVIADAPRAVVERTFRLHLRARPKSSRLQGVLPMEADRAPTVPPELAAVHAQIAAYAPIPSGAS